MSKKTILSQDNPALDFITIPGQQEMDEKGEIKEAEPKLAKNPGNKGEKSTNRAKKTDAPIDYIKEKQRAAEHKTKRLQLLLKQSIYDRIKAAADNYGISVNSYIEAALEERLDKD